MLQQRSHTPPVPPRVPCVACTRRAYQFKYDTVHGRWGGSIEVDGQDLIINGQRV
jgi:glyceraldehyde-3-phosphate dehydrogenase/erythrose-4-phosphate dehydrogenase